MARKQRDEPVDLTAAPDAAPIDATVLDEIDPEQAEPDHTGNDAIEPEHAEAEHSESERAESDHADVDVPPSPDRATSRREWTEEYARSLPRPESMTEDERLAEIAELEAISERWREEIAARARRMRELRATMDDADRALRRLRASSLGGGDGWLQDRLRVLREGVAAPRRAERVG